MLKLSDFCLTLKYMWKNTPRRKNLPSRLSLTFFWRIHEIRAFFFFEFVLFFEKIRSPVISLQKTIDGIWLFWRNNICWWNNFTKFVKLSNTKSVLLKSARPKWFSLKESFVKTLTNVVRQWGQKHKSNRICEQFSLLPWWYSIHVSWSGLRIKNKTCGEQI